MNSSKVILKSDISRLILFLLLLWAFPLHAAVTDSIITKRIDSLIRISNDLSDKSQFKKAIDINIQAENLAQIYFGLSSIEYGNCTYNRGKIHFRESEYLEAEIWALKSVKIRELKQDVYPADYAQSLNLLASIYKNKKDYLGSENIYIKCNTFRKNILGDSHPDFAQGLVNLASLYLEMNKLKESEQLYLQARNIYLLNSGNKNREYATCVNNLAVLYRNINAFEKAKIFYKEALDLRKILVGPNHIEYANTLSNFGIFCIEIGEYEQAERLLLESLEIKQKTIGMNHPDYAKSFHSLVSYYSKIGNISKMISYLNQLIEINKIRYGDSSFEYINNLARLGTAYLKNQEFKLASHCFDSVKPFLNKIQKDSIGNYSVAMNELGNYYSHSGEYFLSETIQRNLLYFNLKKFGPESLKAAMNYNNLGVIFFKMTKFDSALHYFTKSFEIREKLLSHSNLDYISILFNLANSYYAVSNYVEAEKAYAKLMSLQSKIIRNGVNYLTNKELNGLLTIFEKRFSHCISLLENSNYISRNYIDSVYNYLLLTKHFTLNISHLLNNNNSDNNEKVKGTLIELRDIHRAISLAHSSTPINNRKISLLEEKAYQIEKLFLEQLSNFSEYIKIINWKDVQRNLKDGEAVIEFLEYTDFSPLKEPVTKYAAIVLNKDSEHPNFISLCTKAELENKLSISYNFKEKRELPYSKNISQTGNIYNSIIFPLEKHLENINTIYYSPSGLLHKINLNSLTNNQNEFVCDKYNVKTIVSLRKFGLENVKIDTFNDIQQKVESYLFGGIEFDIDYSDSIQKNDSPQEMASFTHWNANTETIELSKIHVRSITSKWYKLKWTLKEVQAVNSILDKSHFKTQLYTGKFANEEAFKKIGSDGKSPKLIHLSTHGYFFEKDVSDSADYLQSSQFIVDPVYKMSEHPMIRSGLILAGANYAWKHGRPYKEGMEDGILTAYEISQMNLSNTELVVLSACETGLGDIRGNEGVYGLQRAFKIAGVKYLIMSLWQVPDKQTSQLMISFYKNWLEKKMTIPDAFQAAQKELRDLGFDPYQWAGFVLIE